MTWFDDRLICGQDVREVLLGDKSDTVKKGGKSRENQPEKSNEIRKTIQSILCTIEMTYVVPFFLILDATPVELDTLKRIAFKKKDCRKTFFFFRRNH